MEETTQLNYGYLDSLSNANHDGTTQQIDDYAQAFVTNNEMFNQKKAVVHQAREHEDEVWLSSMRDPAVKRLQAADKLQDRYVACTHYIIMGHAGLPDNEPTAAPAQECAQVFKDYKFRTSDAYGAESDKIIQMRQNLLSYQAFLTQIGAWEFYEKAFLAAQEVRQILGERALTKAEFVKGEMKAARRATDLAIADLYKIINAMMTLMPTPELTALFNQLRGIELYARQYYISSGTSSSSSSSGSNSSNTGSGSGSDSGNGSGTDSGTGSDSGNGSGGNSGGLPSVGGQETDDEENGGSGTGNSGSDTGGNSGSGTGGNSGGLPAVGGQEVDDEP